MSKVIEKLITARVGLLLKAPFFGNMATRMRLICADEWCPTAATNGRDFYYNTKFVEQLSVKKLEFLFGHEILHCVLDHFGRVGSRDLRLSNIAQDFAVNQILVDERVGDRITEVPICYNAKYRGLSWEEIYDQLWDKAEKISLEKLLTELGEVLDQHIKEQENLGSEDSEGNTNQKRPSLSKEDAQKIRDEIKEAMIQSAAAAGAGRVPAGIQRLIKAFTEPKMNWRQIIRQEIQSIIRNDYSFLRPNRKGWQTGAVLPGLIPDVAIDVAVGIDLSGSIQDDDSKTFLSEIKAIMDQYHDFRINLWCFDTEIYNHKEITQDNSEDFFDYQLRGGGGTRFEANWEFMKENNIYPKKFIMFTDGYPSGSWGDPDYCDTLFIIKGNVTASAPFGQTCIYEKDAALIS